MAKKDFVRPLRCFVSVAATTSVWAAMPCTGVDRRLTEQQRTALAPEIARQLQVKAVDLTQSFRFKGWSVFYVATRQTDDTYIFYAPDPRSSRYITLWGGAALANEQPAIKRWTIKNAPGIPDKLASCFAWHVTKER